MNIKKLLFGLCVLSVLTGACSDDDIKDKVNGDFVYVTLSEKELNAPASGGELTFTITSDKPWTLSGNKSWCSVSPTNGTAGETVVTVKINSEPTLAADRNTVLNISGNPLMVTQKRAGALTVNPDKYSIPLSGDNIHMVLAAEADASVNIPKEYQSWVSKVATGDKTKVNLAISPAKSKIEIRRGEVIVKAKDQRADTIKIYQSANSKLVLEDKNKIVPNNIAGFYVELNSPMIYDVKIPETSTWLKPTDASERLREDRISFTPEAISGEDNRESMIIFTNRYTQQSDTINICQTADGSLLLMKSQFNLTAQGDTISIRMKPTEYTTEVIGGVVWMDKIVIPATRAAGFPKDSVRILVRPNYTPNERTGRVVFTETATGISDTLKIHQAEGPKAQPVANGERAMIASYNTKFKSEATEKIERKGVLVSWRWLTSDPEDIAFDIYRSEAGGEFIKLNDAPIATSSNYKDLTADVTKVNEYQVRQTGSEQVLCSYTFTPQMAQNFYRTIKLNTQVPDPSLVYKAGDAQVADLDGDGENEIVLKREVLPTDNTSDTLQPGTMLLEAYKLDGTFMWQIDLGPNIRQGAHYSPYIVYDLDGDGRAEIAIRTSEGTVFGDGVEIGDVDGDGITRYVNDVKGTSCYGMIMEGPEFLSIIDGASGAELARTDYIPRGAKSTWKDYWGDDWGNRIDRFLMGVGHFNGSTPSVFMCRGYYKNFQIVALDFRGGELRKRWHFNTQPGYPTYAGQGNHNLSVGDVDNDGMDEIIYGACAIDHDGTGLYSTGLGHGDALHLGDFDPTRPGLEVFDCHEEPNQYGSIGSEFRDAASGKLIFGYPGEGKDVGRCLIADIDPETPGCEIWSARPDEHLYSCKGVLLSKPTPTLEGTTIKGSTSINMAIWWSGSLNRQMLDRTFVQSYTDGCLFEGCSEFGVKTINGSKANPCFYGDIWGDWREEMIYVNDDDTELRIFTTDFETEYRFHPLMDDHIYRLSATHQNIGYNQPTHTGFYLGSDLIKK